MNYVNKKTINALYTPVKEETVFPHLPIYEHGVLWQCDCLRLPNDGNSGWCFTVIDCHNLLADAIPLKTTSTTVSMECIIPAIDWILNNSDWLTKPNCIQADNGFNTTVFKEWCDENDIKYRFSQANQSRQQVFIERFNQVLGTRLWKMQVDKEISTGKIDTQWKTNLKTMLELYNNNRMKQLDDNLDVKKPIPKPELQPKMDPNSNYVINNGVDVRLMLKEPEDLFGKKYVNKKFRATDIKWRYYKTYNVIQSFILPGKPILYQIKDNTTDKVMKSLYTGNQLQII